MPMNPRMQQGPTGPTDPAVGVVAMTLADVTFPTTARGFHCNTSGTISVTMHDNTTATFTCIAGQTYPYAIKGTLSAGSSGFAGYALL